MNETREAVVETTANQYLTFRLENERYAFNVGCVREVLEHTTLTTLPTMPAYMEGILNVRGRVLPVVDLRIKFGMPTVEANVDTAIVVIELERAGETRAIGCRTDAVEVVLDIPQSDIQAPPEIGTTVRSEFISGIGSVEDAFVIILDPDRVFAQEELSSLDTMER